MITYNTDTNTLNPNDKVMETIFVRNPTSGNTHTGNGNETILDYVLIPGNTYQSNDEVYWLWLQTKSGTNGAWSGRLRVQTANPGVSGISGGQVITLLTASGGTVVYMREERTMNFLNSISAQIMHNAGSSAISSDRVASTAAALLPAIDFSVDQYILCTGQLSSSLDTITLRSWSCKVSRP
jgi:hypothetical protein